MGLLDTSDKVFWHGYIDFYESFFQKKTFAKIAEIGLFRGNSIRWLLSRFPDARIFGADILALQPEWPVDPRFAFTQLDQGDPAQVRRFLSQTDFDLIIEDGSHHPEHQVLGLMEGVRALRSGGLYILEDIHTSHPAYPDGRLGLFSRRKPKPGNALSVLLAIDHYQRLSIPVDEARGSAIAKGSLLQTGDVLFLAERLSRISLYRRTRLPDHCYKCNSSDYDFSMFRCRCGAEIFSDADSMSFVLEKV